MLMKIGEKHNNTCKRCQVQNQADLEKTGAIPSTNLQLAKECVLLSNSQKIIS